MRLMNDNRNALFVLVLRWVFRCGAGVKGVLTLEIVDQFLSF